MGNYPTSGSGAYFMKIEEKNMLGEGAYAKVFKIMSKD
jgi:hypothetical protein